MKVSEANPLSGAFMLDTAMPLARGIFSCRQGTSFCCNSSRFALLREIIFLFPIVCILASSQHDDYLVVNISPPAPEFLSIPLCQRGSQGEFPKGKSTPHPEPSLRPDSQPASGGRLLSHFVLHPSSFGPWALAP